MSLASDGYAVVNMPRIISNLSLPDCFYISNISFEHASVELVLSLPHDLDKGYSYFSPLKRVN